MKKLNITLLFLLIVSSTFAAVDPAPPYFKISLDEALKEKGAYFVIDDSFPADLYYSYKITHNIDSNLIYHIPAYDVPKMIRVFFKDSSSQTTFLPESKVTYPAYNIYLDRSGKLQAIETATDVYRFKFFLFLSLVLVFWLLVRTIPQHLAVNSEYFSKPFIRFILLQIIYLLLFCSFVFFMQFTGIMIYPVAIIIAAFIDYNYLSKIYVQQRLKRKITYSVITTAFLTLLLTVIALFRFILLGIFER